MRLLFFRYTGDNIPVISKRYIRFQKASMKCLAILLCSLITAFATHAQSDEMTKAFQRGQYDTMIQLGQKMLRTDNKDINAHLGLARAYNAQCHYAKAIPHLKKVLKKGTEDWQFSWADIELMTAYYATGYRRKARTYYEAAGKLKGTDNSNKELQRLGRLLGFDTLYKDWRTAETKNIVFYFEKGIDSTTMQYIIKTRQNAFDSINVFFHADMPKKIDFFVWKSKEIYNPYLKQSLGFTDPTLCLSHNRTNQSAGHEIAHNISFWASKDKKYVRFINEGIGVCFDQGAYDKMEFAAKIFKAHPVDIKGLWTNPRAYDEEVLYPVAGAFVQYLIGYNKTLFLEMNNNQTYQNATAIYGRQLDSLIDQFTMKLKE